MATVAYRDRSSGAYPITLDTIREQAGVLFGEEPPQEVLIAADVDPVEATAPPPYDPLTHTQAENDPEFVSGRWVQSWVVLERPAPQEVSRRQAKIALSRAGLLVTADEAIAAMKGQAGEEARIDWADAGYFRRDNPLILGIGSALGLTEAQIDELFRAAAEI